MMTKEDFSSNMLLAIRELCRRYKVRELSLFGSAITKDFNSASDIDLLVEFEPEAQVGFITLSRMQRELSAILHRPVDLIPKGGGKTHDPGCCLIKCQGTVCAVSSFI